MEPQIRLADVAHFSLLEPELGADVEASLREALAAGAVFPGRGTTSPGAFRHASTAIAWSWAIRAIEMDRRV